MALSSVDSVVHLLNNWLMLIESFKYYFSYIACLFEIHVVYSGLHLNNKVSRSQMLLTIHDFDDYNTQEKLEAMVW